MSLIEEALRRLQDPVIQKTTAASPRPAAQVKHEQGAPVHSWPTTTPPSAAPPQTPSRTSPALIVVAIAVFGLALLLFGAGAWWMGRLPVRSTPTALPVQRVTAQPASAALGETTHREPTTAPSAGAHADFTISGVVEGLGVPYAVINGAIVSAGDHIGDATLVQIGHGSVTLRRADGQDVVLQVPR